MIFVPVLLRVQGTAAEVARARIHARRQSVMRMLHDYEAEAM